MSLQPYRFPSIVLVAAGLLAGIGCAKLTGERTTAGTEGPCASQPGMAINSAGDAEKPRKVIWAESRLFCEAPPLEVRTWLTKQPELEGKFVLIEFWRTWCGACKRSVPLLNSFHEKYGKELVVIAITGEPEETVRAYNGPKMNYFMAIDKPAATAEAASVTEPVAQNANAEQNGEQAGCTSSNAGGSVIKDQGTIEQAFGVWGWPHVVLLEPEHHSVIWEGFPLLNGYELTAEKIERALAIGRKQKAAAKP